MSSDMALYVHIPFCRRKCYYCSFISFEQHDSDIPQYIDALIREMELRSQGDKLTTIFLGGGTPSLVPPDLYVKLFTAIKNQFNLDPTAEVSMEVNPGTINEEYLIKTKQAGVNRLSLGVQSLNDKELMMLGRIHTASEAAEAVIMARKAGFTNLNIDLIYGLPGQTLSVWRTNLEKALELKPDHLSLYALTLEEDAPLQKIIDKGSLTPIDPDISADQYELAEDLLESAGYTQYEISNWARSDMECRHNLVYWQNRPYLGIGIAAHSCLNNHRLANTNCLNSYLARYSKQTPYEPEMDEFINRDLELAETIILGLRLNKGIQVEDINRRYGINLSHKFCDKLDEMTKVGLLEQVAGNIRLTRRGRFLSNQVFWHFLPEEQS